MDEDIEVAEGGRACRESKERRVSEICADCQNGSGISAGVCAEVKRSFIDVEDGCLVIGASRHESKCG